MMIPPDLRRVAASGPRWLALAALLACGDAGRPVAAPDAAPAPAISDAARDAAGIAGFYFLPPMLPEVAYPGAFDPALAPEVVICEWTGTECGAEIARFTTIQGTGGEPVKVQESHYHVNWHTKTFDLDPAKTYRIQVLAGGFGLGFADVDLVGPGELKNKTTGEFIVMEDGRTLPIKFRAERGIVGRIAVDPAEVQLEVGESRRPVVTVYDLHDSPLPGGGALPGGGLIWGLPPGGNSPATIGGDGEFTGVSPGSGSATVSIGGRGVSVPFIVYEPPVSITFIGTTVTLPIGTAEPLVATAYDAGGNAITRPLHIDYSTSAPDVATVGGTTGVLTGVASGLVTITATTGFATPVSTTTTRLVHESPGTGLATVGAVDANGTVVAGPITIDIGDIVPLDGYYGGITLSNPELVGGRGWFSSNDGIVSIGPDGRATAIGPGTATIELRVGDLTGTVVVTVPEAPPPPPPPPPTGAPVTVPFDPTWVSIVANDVNDHGVVVGTITLPSTAGTRAFRWDSAGIDTLPMKGATRCVANAISNQGRIVGTCTWTGTGAGTFATLWDNGGGATWDDSHVTTFPSNTTLSNKNTSALDINDDGPNVYMTGTGLRTLSCGSFTCSAINMVRWTNGVAANLGWYGVWASPSSAGHAINAAGNIAGASTVPIVLSCMQNCPRVIDVQHPARVVSTGGVGDLGVAFIPPENTGTGLALGINAGKDAVGWIDQYITSPSVAIRHHATYWPFGSPRTGVPGIPHPSIAASEATDINDARWIVGAYAINAFVWKGTGTAVVLDPLVPGKSARASSISQLVFDPVLNVDKAFVAGSAVSAAGKTVAVRWVVVP